VENTPAGTEDAPFTTIGEALEGLKTLYAEAGNARPMTEEGSGKMAAGIVIMGNMNADPGLSIESSHPPIVLMGDTGGASVITLTANTSGFITVESDRNLTLRNIEIRG
jgi:hypothetical protein